MKKKARLLYKNPIEFDKDTFRRRKNGMIFFAVYGIFLILLMAILLISNFQSPLLIIIIIPVDLIFISIVLVSTSRNISRMNFPYFRIDSAGIRLNLPKHNNLITFDKIERIYIDNIDSKFGRRRIVIILDSKGFIKDRTYLGENQNWPNCVPDHELERIFKIIENQIEAK